MFQYQTGGVSYTLLKKYAEDNRRNATDAEIILWDFLKGRQLGVKFNRQHVIGDFIVDFVCLEQNLVIEVDGGYHSEPRQHEDDIKRQDWLEENKFRVIRFTNDEIIGDTERVLKEIKDKLSL